MPDSGSGVITPIAPGAGVGLKIAQPLPYTLLSLPRYARIMGINPAHFAGGHGDSVWPFSDNRCNDLWARYSWQHSDSVSHQDLALAIREAEAAISRELGWWPAPVWTSQEVRQFPRHHRRDLYKRYGRNVRAQRSSVRTQFAKVIAPGRRATTKLGTATYDGGGLKYTDEDSDGFIETATVQLATSLTDPSEIKVYITGMNADQRWEIRPPRSKTISGGFFVARFDSWLFVDPDLVAGPTTTAGFTGLRLGTTANLVSDVDVYREYNDTTAVSAEMYWEPVPRSTIIDGFCSVCGGEGCPACSLTVQDGCLHVRDADLGFVVPTPAAYDGDEAAWEQASYSECRDPDFVKIWYYSGDLSEGWLRGSPGFNEMLPDRWALAIARLATARLERPFCSCGNVIALAQRLQRDLAAISSDTKQAQSYNVDPEIVLRNPFGTLTGEVMAWQEVRRERDRLTGGGVI